MDTLFSRIAPTPSGFLHKGNLFNFLLTALLTKQCGGELRLRIDDMDAQRAQPKYISDIFQTLNWLGISWQHGPLNINQHLEHFAQQLRLSIYDSLLQELIGKAEVYACTCSRKELSVRGYLTYPGTCRNKHLPLNREGASWRIHVPEETTIQWADLSGIPLAPIKLDRQMGDFIIRRKDGLPAYQIVSLADDLFYQTNFIVRGADLVESTAAQLWLAGLLSKEPFIQTRFFHHPLLVHADGEKLSKSALLHQIKPLHESSKTPAEVIKDFTRWIGWSVEAGTFEQLLYYSNRYPVIFSQ